MLRGDLKTTPLSDLLKRLADAKATGCVYVQPGGRRSLEATVALREGAICNAVIPGAEEAVGARLVANRRLTPADLAEAREAQETELATWTMAELLIHLGLADQDEVEALVLEQALAALTELCEWPAGSWRFRRRERTGPSLPTPLAISDALATVADRQAEWRELRSTVHSADAIVSLAAHPDGANSTDSAPNLEMDADGFALLCAVDGTKTLAELAGSTGFTLLDAARKVSALVESGLVQISHSCDDDEDEPADDADRHEDGDGGGSRSLADIAAAFAFDGPSAADLEVGLSPVGAPWQPPRTAHGDTLADALARVSAALSVAMTPEDETDESATAETETETEARVETEVEVEVFEFAAEESVERVVEDAAEDAVAEAVESQPSVEAGPELDLEIETAETEEAILEPEADNEVEVEVRGEAELEVEAGAEESDEYLAAVITLPFAVEEPTENDEPTEPTENDEPSDEVEGLEPVEAVEAVEAPEAPDVIETLEDEAGEAVALETDVEVQVEELVEFEAEAQPEAESEPGPEPVVELEAVVQPEPEPAHVETAHESRASAANAARLLSQFSEEFVARQPEPEAEPEPEPEPEAPPAAPEGHAPRPRRENGLADTAALLRELSGLSTETTSSAQRMPNRPTPAPAVGGGGQHARKRKGLFGRS